MRLDSPHLLIVEGNPPIANARVMEYGARPYGPAYADVLRLWRSKANPQIVVV